MDEIFEKLKLGGDVIKNNQDIFVWGAGNTALLYASAFREEGIQPLAFVDNHVADDNVFLGIPVISPKELKKKKGLILICSQNPHMVAEISDQIKDEIKLPYLTVNLFVFLKHIDEIKKCVDLLEDEQSKDIYVQVLTSWLESKFPPSRYYTPMQYFAHERFMLPDASEVFVDLGAFVGDTIERFLFAYDGTFKKIIAFEPDPRNFDALKFRIQRLEKEWAITRGQVKLIKAGAGRKTSVMKMEQTKSGRASKVSTDGTFGDSDCQIYAMDDFFKEEKITFLKADIESFEYDMLLGAEKIIRRDLPKLALSIYHNPLDMFRIMLWVDSLGLGYKFAVRHHSFSFADTVLYAHV